MALRLMQYAHHSPDVGWPADGKRFVVLNGERVVGTIGWDTGGTAGDRWTWSVTDLRVVPAPLVTSGWEDTKDAAKAAFAKTWRSCMKLEGLQEED